MTPEICGMRLFPAVLVWFCSNACYNFVLKAFLQNLEWPHISFFFCSVLSGQCILLSIICFAKGEGGKCTEWGAVWGLVQQGAPCLILTGIIAGALADVGTLGVYLTSSVALAQAIKCLEPLFLLAWNIILREKRYSYESFIAVHLVVAGVLVASWSDPSLSMKGVSIGILGSLGTTLRATVASWYCDEGGCVFSFLWVCNSFLLLPYLIGTMYVLTLLDGDQACIFGEALLVSGLFSLYYIVSYTVLGATEAVYHGNLNAAKRGFVLICASIVGTKPTQGPFAIGMSLSFVGMFMYSETKLSIDRRASSRVLRKVFGESFLRMANMQYWLYYLLLLAAIFVTSLTGIGLIALCREKILYILHVPKLRQLN